MSSRVRREGNMFRELDRTEDLELQFVKEWVYNKY